MGRYTKIILIISAFLLLIASFSLFTGDKNNISIKVKKNEIVIDNFEMAKVVDEENNFYKINAKKAIINKESKKADLTQFRVVYKKGQTDFTASADKGVLIEEVVIDVSGKIKGVANGLKFETGSDGLFYYDFNTEIGEIEGGVTVDNDEAMVVSDRATIYHRQNLVEFDGNVKAEYK
jgi:hypothetical protein